MLSDAAAAALRDMAHHIEIATKFTAGLSYEVFREDTRTIYAVTRCLEIISEASRRLPPEIKSRHPSIAWKDMAGAGNIYRHEYEDVAARLIWDTVQVALPPLRDVVAHELAADEQLSEEIFWKVWEGASARPSSAELTYCWL